MDHLFQEEQQEELRKNQFYFTILKDREMTDEDKTQVIAQDELVAQRNGATGQAQQDSGVDADTHDVSTPEPERTAEIARGARTDDPVQKHDQC